MNVQRSELVIRRPCRAYGRCCFELLELPQWNSAFVLPKDRWARLLSGAFRGVAAQRLRRLADQAAGRGS